MKMKIVNGVAVWRGFLYNENPLNNELFDNLEGLSSKKRKKIKSVLVDRHNEYTLGDYQQEVIEGLLEDHDFNGIHELVNSGLYEPDIDVDDKIVREALKTSKKRVLTAPHNF